MNESADDKQPAKQGKAGKPADKQAGSPTDDTPDDALASGDKSKGDTASRVKGGSRSKADKPSQDRQHVDESIKDTFESIIIAFVLAFVFRAYVVEAFVIPTGSMAPTLLGQHYDLSCNQCGYRYATESMPGQAGQSICPMCRFPNPVSAKAAVRSGDRILVHKYIYSISEPRRWDVVVFKNPEEPHTNFIKRLVGLPGEDLRLVEGNVYVKNITEDDTLWRIARKTDRPRVQRDVWQPMYHSQYVPLDLGKRSNPNRRGRVRGLVYEWEVPWQVEQVGTPDAWDIEGRSSYRYNSDDAGAIRFDYAAMRFGVESLYPYNYNNRIAYFEPIEDVRIAASVVMDKPTGIVRMETTGRLNNPDRQDESVPIVAVIDARGSVRIETTPDPFRDSPVLAEATIDPLDAGTPHDVEFWFVDQRASVWIDGDEVVSWSFDIPMQRVLDRPALQRDPKTRIVVDESPMTLHRVEMDRDLYYSTRTQRDTYGVDARGGMVKDPEQGYIYDDGPVRILPDRFFCMGDNSPHSHDSRYWDDVDHFVAERMFEADEDPHGMVPRKLMMGRAFFVYLPAPYALKPEKTGYFPNFGDMRFIH